MWRDSHGGPAARPGAALPAIGTLLPGLGALLLALGVAGCDEGPTAVRDLTPPAAPQGVYSETGDGQVTLRWIRNTEPDLRQYFVWRGPAYDGPYHKLDATVSTTFIDDTAVNGTTYYYAVSAIDQSGNESELSAEHVLDTPRPEGFGLSLVNAAVAPDGPAAYDFSAGELRLASDTSADVYYYVTGGVRLLVASNARTNVQDAGFHELADLDWAPDAGWSPVGEVELIPGHAYYVWTSDDHYAKVRVTALDNAHVVLDWAYQLVGGNPELKPIRPQTSRLSAARR
jgi:hypothetical protein